MNRVKENANYLMRTVIEALDQSEDKVTVDPAVLFGYDKLLISATEAGKVYGLQAWNGLVAW